MRGELIILFLMVTLAPPNIYLYQRAWSLLYTNSASAQTPGAKATTPRPTYSEGLPLGLISATFFPPPVRRGQEEVGLSRLTAALGFLTCWQLQRQDGGASSPELSSYTWGKGGGGQGQGHSNYCSLLGWEPALRASPSTVLESVPTPNMRKKP